LSCEVSFVFCGIGSDSKAIVDFFYSISGSIFLAVFAASVALLSMHRCDCGCHQCDGGRSCERHYSAREAIPRRSIDLRPWPRWAPISTVRAFCDGFLARSCAMADSHSAVKNRNQRDENHNALGFAHASDVSPEKRTIAPSSHRIRRTSRTGILNCS
jgi:hypothetical protein